MGHRVLQGGGVLKESFLISNQILVIQLGAFRALYDVMLKSNFLVIAFPYCSQLKSMCDDYMFVVCPVLHLLPFVFSPSAQIKIGSSLYLVECPLHESIEFAL